MGSVVFSDIDFRMAWSSVFSKFGFASEIKHSRCKNSKINSISSAESDFSRFSKQKNVCVVIRHFVSTECDFEESIILKENISIQFENEEKSVRQRDVRRMGHPEDVLELDIVCLAEYVL